MKILVCISEVPDTTAKIILNDDNTALDQANMQKIMNPYDEWYALVRAIELKETLNYEVTVLTVGTEKTESILRKGLAIGADKAVRIDKSPSDSFNTAQEIANYAKDKAFNMILCGKETIDYNGSSVAGIIAEFLDYPFVSLANKLDINGEEAIINCEEQGGEKVLKVKGPFVLSIAKGMAEARIPNMRGIMTARSKPLEVIAPSENDSLTEIISYEPSPEKSTCKMIDPNNVEELVNELKNHAKVL